MKRFRIQLKNLLFKKKMKYKNYSKNQKLHYKNKIVLSKKVLCKKLLNMRNLKETKR